jgi:FdhD protein
VTPVTAVTAGPRAIIGGTATVQIERIAAAGRAIEPDRVAVEAPLEFWLHHPLLAGEPASFGATMRTPGEDDALAAGLLFGEGVVQSLEDIEAIETSTRRPNVVNVRLHATVALEFDAPARRFSAGSSCGVCGTTGLDAAIARAAATRIGAVGGVELGVLLGLPDRMRRAQSKFGATGGIHAAALFDRAGTLLAIAEDVGRHNAFDKLVGASLLAGGLPWSERIALLSGRASFELVQKALRAGAGILAAIGAPSSLAVNLAVQTGLTLVGFLRADQCNIYCHGARILEGTLRPR